jgi:tRNA(Ile)-lysidine synthase
MKKIWLALEHQIKNDWEKAGLSEKLKKRKFLIACSGGLDSVAAVNFLQRLGPFLQGKLGVLHVHHGQKSNQAFRDQAAEFVESLCKKEGLPFYFHQGQALAKANEKDLREIRKQAYQKFLQATGSDYLVTGHHQQDLLETRLIRLIRGTGPLGFRAMEVLRPPFFRPFLATNKKQLLQYAEELKLAWCEDPSNRDNAYLRNWLRNRWLPQLEKKRPGALATLSRSFEQLTVPTDGVTDERDFSQGLDRMQYIAHNPSRQREELILYLQFLGAKDFRHSQIEELRKRLDKDEKIHTFIVAKIIWQVNAERIFGRKLLV